MEVLQARIDSFRKSKRIKNPSKQSSTVTVRWPHPSNFKANPETLGAAGFFYNPSYDGPDSVTCYFCDKELEGWEEEDDPHAIHWKKCGQTCCWAIVRCGLLNDTDKSSRFIFTDKTRVPTHKLMEKARFDTFDVGNGWIHDQVKNHNANSKMMARAGFVYTPQQSNDDLVTCLYCNTSLSGWDADDDPMEEHRRRKKSCPFFSASALGTGSQSQSTKPPSKSKPPTRSVSKSRHQNILLPTKTHDGDNDSDSSRPIKVRSRSKSATRSEPEESNAEGEIQKKTLRSRSKTKAKDEDVPRKSSRPKSKASKGHEVPPKPSRTRTNTKVFESEPEEEPLTTIKPRSTSQQTPPPKVIPALSKLLVQPSNPLPSDPAVSPIREIDVVDHIAPETQPERNNFVDTTPSTPQISFQTPPKTKVFESEPEEPLTTIKPRSTSQQTPPPKVIPALSKLLVQPSNPLPSVPADLPIEEIDVVDHIAPETQPEMNTPQRSFQTPPKTKVSESEPEEEFLTTIEPRSTSQQTPPPKAIPALSKLLVQPSIPLPSVPAVLPIEEIDVVDHIAPETQPETNNYVDTTPSTPQRSFQTPPKKVTISFPKAVPSTTVELIPALSKLPSIPLHTLTEAELDMTVEEWIRYQMDVEYDKFRRDGERELQRFRNQAEEVRKAIEGL